MLGVAVIVVVLALVPDRHQSVAFVFTETLNNSGFGDHSSAFVFGLGLLMAQYTITGYDASAHMSEETQAASRAAAWGTVMSVVISVLLRLHPAGGCDIRRPGRPGHRGRRCECRDLHLVHRARPDLGRTAAVHRRGGPVLLRHGVPDRGSRMLFAFSGDRRRARLAAVAGGSRPPGTGQRGRGHAVLRRGR